MYRMCLYNVCTLKKKGNKMKRKYIKRQKSSRLDISRMMESRDWLNLADNNWST